VFVSVSISECEFVSVSIPECVFVSVSISECVFVSVSSCVLDVWYDMRGYILVYMLY
jgi:hypothetical protein